MNLFSKIASSIILFPILAKAFDPGIIRQLNDMNAQKSTSPIIQCSHALQIPFTRPTGNIAEYNDCMVSLCGLSKDNPSAYLSNLNFSKLLPTQLQQKIEKLNPIISKILDKNKTENIKQLNDLNKTFSDLESIDFNNFSPTFKSELNNILFGKYISEEVDVSLSKEDRVRIKLNTPANSTTDFKKAIEEYAKRLKESKLSDPNYFVSNNIYSKDEMRQMISNSVANYQIEYKNISLKLDENQKKNLEEQLSRLSDKIKKLDENDSSFLSAFNDFYYLESTTQSLNPDYKISFKTDACESENCKKVILDYFKKLNIPEMTNKMKADLNKNELRIQSHNRCKAGLMAQALAETDLATSKKLFAEAKIAIKNNVLPKFSEHSRKILNNYLEKQLVVKNQNMVKLLLEKEKDVVATFDESAKSYLNEKSEPFKFEQEEYQLRNAILIKENQSSIDPFSNNESPCSSELQIIAWDSFLPVSKLLQGNKEEIEKSNLGDKDTVFVSHFSCTHNVQGKQAVAHEIGHALNSVFAEGQLSAESAKKYNGMRSCATENYSDASLDRTFYTQEGDTVYTEEDMADVFAYAAFTKEKKLFSCSLLKPAYYNGGYSELSFRSDQEDRHSTPFSRVLLEAVNKGIVLPISCQRLINNEEHKMSFKKCI